MIKKIFNISNLIYVIILLIASIYLVCFKGWNYYLNYASILLSLFLPIFIFILIYKIIRQAIVKENIAKSDIYSLITQVFVALVAIFIGLDKTQRFFLVVFDMIICFFIFLIMLYISFRKKI